MMCLYGVVWLATEVVQLFRIEWREKSKLTQLHSSEPQLSVIVPCGKVHITEWCILHFSSLDCPLPPSTAAKYCSHYSVIRFGVSCNVNSTRQFSKQMECAALRSSLVHQLWRLFHRDTCPVFAILHRVNLHIIIIINNQYILHGVEPRASVWQTIWIKPDT